jgi:hypothetical protein
MLIESPEKKLRDLIIEAMYDDDDIDEALLLLQQIESKMRNLRIDNEDLLNELYD